MERLWSPWRLAYVTGSGETNGCVFCDAADDLILIRGRVTFVILNKYPYNNGHVMVVPYRHVAEFHVLDRAARDELGELTALALEVLSACYNAGGFNVGINQGAAAGAGIAAHLHQHVVPRWAGDTNFMPVVADTRVLPEGLAQSYKKIREGFAARSTG